VRLAPDIGGFVGTTRSNRTRDDCAPLDADRPGRGGRTDRVRPDHVRGSDVPDGRLAWVDGLAEPDVVAHRLAPPIRHRDRRARGLRIRRAGAVSPAELRRALQTFLPYPDFDETAAVLDARRLGKQRVEVIQIVRALTVPDYAWKQHPAVLMWKGHEEALGAYGSAVVRRWCALGFADTCEATIAAGLAAFGVGRIRSQAVLAEAGELPTWLGDERLHLSHRSALVRKDPEHYRLLFPGVPDDIEYWWPVRSPNVIAAEERRAVAARRRIERAAAKAAAEAERAARRRSAAAKRAAATRARNRAARPT
jgi:hypothetical protein